jgi:hypothetical protein
MSKLKNEPLLVKEALRIGLIYAEKRGVAKFDKTDSQHQKIEYIYRLLVHDKLVQPVPKDQENEKLMKHKLALWIAKQLPEGHKLLQ